MPDTKKITCLVATHLGIVCPHQFARWESSAHLLATAAELRVAAALWLAVLFSPALTSNYLIHDQHL